jgi:hypothetical protein
MKLGVAALLAAAVVGLLSAQDTERSFAGTWTASGRRESVPVEGGGGAAVVYVSGAVVLAADGGLGRGFRGQAVGFDDGSGMGIGRCVWTDEKGDRIFSRLQGESMAAGRRFVGTITGGTGRYAGVTGEYSFTWQYVIHPDEAGGAIQGRAIRLEGRVRGGSPRP